MPESIHRIEELVQTIERLPDPEARASAVALVQALMDFQTRSSSTTSGIGVVEYSINVSATRAQAGDKVILSGTLGDHGTTIMIARGELDLETDIESDWCVFAFACRRHA